MKSHNLQHLVPATIIFALAIIVTWLSFTQQPAEAYSFPRVISAVFVALAVWNFIRAATGLARVGRGIEIKEVQYIAPGLTVMLLLVFWGAKALGFYVASAIAFFAIYSLYDPSAMSSFRDWLKRVLVTMVFMAIIHILFSTVLQVHTPRGIFF